MGQQEEAAEAKELLEQKKRVERLHRQFVRSIWKLLFTLLAIGGICYAAYLTVKLVIALAPVILLLIIIA